MANKPYVPCPLLLTFYKRDKRAGVDQAKVYYENYVLQYNFFFFHFYICISLKRCMLFQVYKQFFPDIAIGYKDPRVTLHIGNGTISSFLLCNSLFFRYINRNYMVIILKILFLVFSDFLSQLDLLISKLLRKQSYCLVLPFFFLFWQTFRNWVPKVCS